MSLLGWLTLGWAATLVLALAVGLTAVALRLRRIGALLGEAGDALDDVRERTRGLDARLEGVEKRTGGIMEGFGPAGEDLRLTHRHLERILDRLGLRAGAR